MKNVIFDFGNVVIQWHPYRALSGIFSTEAVMVQTLSEIGFYDWNALQDRGRSWDDALVAARRDQPQHAHIFQAYVDGLGPAHNTLVPGTSELITALHANDVSLFGLTNAALQSFEVVKTAAPAIGLLQDVVISSLVGCMKPDPEIYRICLSRNDLDPAVTLFVDDSAANCDAARALGLATHHFSDAAGLKTDLRQRGLL